ncbi:MAG: cysteine desulfurase NifS [Clostridia bacterium]|nr:cysteine desulfurase NifS [Clostridia bacterium]
MNDKKLIYVDNGATTRVLPEVVEAMTSVYNETFGNPSSLYSLGRNAKTTLEEAREKIASLIGCDPKELYFTSCGTESDNWAIKGIAANALKYNKGKHIITSKIEHHAVDHTLKALEKQGFEVTYLDVYENGIVRPEDLEKAIREDTILVTVMYVNNEIGTIQPIKELAAIAKSHKIPFFTDAVQAVGKLDVKVKELGVDMLSMSAHKFNGPKGVGALYVRRGLLPANLIEGGGQEKGKRSGTENVAGIVGMAKALELAYARMGERAKIKEMRDYLAKKLLAIPYTRLNGDKDIRIDENVNVSFEFIEGESLLLLLDMYGICASTGSACSSNSLDPSHVLLAIGLPHEIAHGSLRITIGEDNTFEDMDYIAKTVESVVSRLREMSPLYDAFLRSKE